MSIYNTHQIRQVLDKLELENETKISLKDLESKLKIIPVVNSIVQTIRAVSNNYLSPSLRNEISGQTTRDDYVQDHIPVISLGRRQGHTSAIIELVQNAHENIVVVVPNNSMLSAYTDVLSDPRPYKSSGYFIYNDKVKFVTQTNFATYENMYAIHEDPLIILESVSSSKLFLESSKVRLTGKYIIVGN